MTRRNVQPIERLKMLPIAVAIATTGFLVSLPGLAVAEAEEEIEEITVTGLRGKPRTATDSPVPIDVFNADTIDTVSYTDMDNIMQTLVPSYNVSRQALDDGATFIRPATLRNLPSHHTLVLVNGKRRHRAALVSVFGLGTQGPDLAMIPSVAIESIEVLRDGASSQYGSDAIAGVINFNLKQNNEGGSLTVATGEYFEGDGFNTTVMGNVGLPLGDTGFFNLSAEYTDSDFTERAVQYCEPWFCLDTGNPRFDETAGYADYVLGRAHPTDPRQSAIQQAFPAGIPLASVDGKNTIPWGVPNHESVKVFFNAGIELSNGMELYSFGNYAESESDGTFFWRYPGNGTIEDLRLSDGSIYTPLELFPGSFTPRFKGEVTDYSIAGGLKGFTKGGLSWDVSARFGSNEISYTLFNTINPSLGPATPTSFRPGDLVNEELQLQADFSMDFDVGMYSPLTFAFGLSYMDEEYQVIESRQPASYEAGPFATSDPFGFCNDDGTATAAGLSVITAGSSLDCSDDNDPVYRVVGVGSNGFPGYSPAFSDDYTRDSYAIYGDLSADVTDSVLLQAALRYEDYSDFGDELVGKLAGLVKISPAFALRASIGTGFRAPTPGQQGTTNVSTRSLDGVPTAAGLFPASSPVAAALGASPLDPETSKNFTFGFTADLDILTLTVDYYLIEIDDRFYPISLREVSTDPTSGDAYQNFLALDNAGVAGANSIGGVFYYSNALDSKTTGVDIVTTMAIDWDSGMSTSLTASVNYNKSSIESDASAFLGPEEQYDFENLAPEWRGVFTAVHDFSPAFSLMTRISYYGESTDSNDSGTTFTGFQDYGATVFVDLEGSYRFNENYSLSLGGRNIFDEYPDQVDRVDSGNDYCCGILHQEDSYAPWQGGYYFVRMNAHF